MSSPRCKQCKQPFPEQRSQMGYSTCVNCSAEPKWSAVPVINHKTGNEVQIVKDPAVAEEFIAKSARVGFGTMRGISGGYKPRPKQAAPAVVILPDAPPREQEVARRSLPHEFDQVGEIVMELAECGKWEEARLAIDEARSQKRIWGNQQQQLHQILNELQKLNIS